MAKVSFGINGFGRIGRLVMRAALDNPGEFFHRPAKEKKISKILRG